MGPIDKLVIFLHKVKSQGGQNTTNLVREILIFFILWGSSIVRKIEKIHNQLIYQLQFANPKIKHTLL